MEPGGGETIVDRFGLPRQAIPAEPPSADSDRRRDARYAFASPMRFVFGEARTLDVSRSGLRFLASQLMTPGSCWQAVIVNPEPGGARPRFAFCQARIVWIARSAENPETFAVGAEISPPVYH